MRLDCWDVDLKWQNNYINIDQKSDIETNSDVLKSKENYQRRKIIYNDKRFSTP